MLKQLLAIVVAIACWVLFWTIIDGHGLVVALASLCIGASYLAVKYASTPQRKPRPKNPIGFHTPLAISTAAANRTKLGKVRCEAEFPCPICEQSHTFEIKANPGELQLFLCKNTEQMFQAKVIK